MPTPCQVCSHTCFGSKGYHGGCCTLEERDFIIGPHKDAEQFVQRVSERMGSEVKYEEVFVDYEEGRKMFPNRESWQNEKSYPALRVDTSHPRKPCIFYHNDFRICTVYDIRPQTCKDYACDYLKQNRNNDCNQK
jgi:Fe-S-cluster containining protein